MTTINIEDVPTPCFLVDLDVVERNCKKMRERCQEMGVALRPHMKTHKTLEIGKIMTGGTKRRVVVSTVAEAEFFADGGFDDILYAYPFTADKIPRLKKLAERLELFHVMVDDKQAADWLKDHPLSRDKKWNVWVKVDAGYGRAGKPWDSPELLSLAKHINAAHWCKFQGIYTHCGQSYDVKGEKNLQLVSSEAADRLLQVASALEAEGVKCPQVTTGSTPSCSKPGEYVAKLTEVHPGNYVFYDLQQCLVGSCHKEDVAVRVATRVIGHYPHNKQILVDCGFLGLSHDGKGSIPNGALCTVDGHPELIFNKMSQECGYITVFNDEDDLEFDRFPVGSLLYLIPYHSCATAAMHPFYYIHRDLEIIGKWTPCRGW